VGKLKRCTRSTAFDFAGNRHEAAGEVTLNSFDGVRNGVLAVDQDVDGHWCKRGTEVERPDSRAVRFTLARDETISGIACKASAEVVIEVAGRFKRPGDRGGKGRRPLEDRFHPGAVAIGWCYSIGRFTDFNVYKGSGYGHLAEAATVEGIAYQAGALVRFQMANQK
jgi:hypothetical protein